jgi:hypothetical protein
MVVVLEKKRAGEERDVMTAIIYYIRKSQT